MDTLFHEQMTNKEMASLLFNIATLLRRKGNENPFRTAAYERGARALMALREEAQDVLRSQTQVPFHPSRHIGRKLQGKIREMVETGGLEQYNRMVIEELPESLVDLMGVPGIGPTLAEQIHQSLGISTAQDLVQAARNGRLRSVRGFGPNRTARIAALRLPLEDGSAEPRSSLPQMVLFDLPRAA